MAIGEDLPRVDLTEEMTAARTGNGAKRRLWLIFLALILAGGGLGWHYYRKAKDYSRAHEIVLAVAVVDTNGDGQEEIIRVWRVATTGGQLHAYRGFVDMYDPRTRRTLWERPSVPTGLNARDVRIISNGEDLVVLGRALSGKATGDRTVVTSLAIADGKTKWQRTLRSLEPEGVSLTSIHNDTAFAVSLKGQGAKHKLYAMRWSDGSPCAYRDIKNTARTADSGLSDTLYSFTLKDSIRFAETGCEFIHEPAPITLQTHKSFDDSGWSFTMPEWSHAITYKYSLHGFFLPSAKHGLVYGCNTTKDCELTIVTRSGQSKWSAKTNDIGFHLVDWFGDLVLVSLDYSYVVFDARMGTFLYGFQLPLAGRPRCRVAGLGFSCNGLPFGRAPYPVASFVDSAVPVSSASLAKRIGASLPGLESSL